MAPDAGDITFVIPGQPQAVGRTRGASGRTVKSSVRVGVQRDGGTPVRVTARPGEDVVVLTIANGPTLVLHPEDARDLLRAQGGTTRDAAKGGSANEVQVSAQLGWPGLEAAATRGATRGWMGQAVLSAVDVITGLFKDPAADLAAAAITRKVDGATDEGVYQLSPEALPASLNGSGLKRAKVPAAEDGGPLLVLVHGTFVDTVSTFGKLWTMHPKAVQRLFEGYKGRVYALDHQTMGRSPISNALTLARSMPAGARLHLVTHSRGGMVAEVMARACGGGALGAEELAKFADEKYADQRADLQELVKTAQAKGLKVERVVRVACPARGTLLASKRFDAFLSVLQWGLQIAGVPVAPQFVDFLHEVARRRADPSVLPGIEAMMPDSAVVAWLNGCEESIPGELRVVAGDLQGDSIGSWVKTLVSDAFFWTDNDLVVQTRSMYGGTPRTMGAAAPAATFLLDRGAKVTHFNYFANPRTVAAIVGALLDPAPADFKAIGPLSWAGEDAGGTRGARAAARSRGGPGANPAERPAVFVLPGILGSHLKCDGHRIWLSFRFLNGLMKLAWDPSTVARFEPDGPIGLAYDDLIERLADTHEVIPFAYDWRRPIEEEARRLAAAVDAKLSARDGTRQPVRIVAHSMGGLVARAMQLERPESWQRMMARDGARVLMLGTPNGGSWAPMQTLSGDDTFGNALVAFGSLFANARARKMMAGLPGFIQLQAALLDPALGLDRATTWERLASEDMAVLRSRSFWHDLTSQCAIYEWGAPPQAVLDQAVALRRRLDAQVASLVADAGKLVMVIGHSTFTPAGIEMGPDGLQYANTVDDGDGRVTLDSALLPGVRAWKVDADHGKLPDVASAFAAYLELLNTGQTQLLEPHQPGARPDGKRGAADTARTTRVLTRPSRGRQESMPPSSEAEVMGRAADGQRLHAGVAALGASVLHGDLRFVRQPLMVGHYRSMKLTGTESIIDPLVGMSMSRSLSAGLYPDATGSHQIFDNQRRDPRNPLAMARPAAVVIVGLGEEGKLQVVDLVYTVRQGILAYAQRLSERTEGAPAHFDMAATLLASGGKGITAGTSAQLIVQGVLEANERLKQARWPEVGNLTLVELSLDRATDAWRALQAQQLTAPNQLRVLGRIEVGPGAQRPLDLGYRGADYDLISALTVSGEVSGSRAIAYTIDTRRARTETRAQRAQGTLVSQLVANASNDASTDTQIGRTLFNLLVPPELESFLGGSGEMVIELDPGTAGIPWELLDTNPDARSSGERPWAIRSKLVRKLRTPDFRSQVSDANADDGVLVIGEPDCDPKRYPRLEGARREAVAVADRIRSTGMSSDRVVALVDRNDARTIINALFARRYRVVHVAGHGAPTAGGGVVLSGDEVQETYLGANEVRAMRTVPELVFLNCCHLAAQDPGTVLKRYDRSRFAANIAEELIRAGVRCVVAAGWAVEDVPAEQFATSFYSALLEGKRFIEAVGAAREAAWNANRQGNTWAAYQCYGDPEWTWGSARSAAAVGDKLVGISTSGSLVQVLEALAIQAQYGFGDPDRLKNTLDSARNLEAEFATLWGARGAVAEAFGAVYASARAFDKAIEWYRTALAAPDGGSTFRAAEQLGNLLARRGEEHEDAAEIRSGIGQLESLVASHPTLERQRLLGSAYRSLAIVASRVPRRKAEVQKALDGAVEHFRAAEEMAHGSGAEGRLVGPAMSAIACELRRAFLKGSAPRMDEARLRAVRDALERAAAEEPEFRPVAAQIELRILAALSRGNLAGEAEPVTAALRDLKARVPATRKWRSLDDEVRFSLEPYLAVAGPAEKRAARDLLELLKELSGPEGA